MLMSDWFADMLWDSQFLVRKSVTALLKQFLCHASLVSSDKPTFLRKKTHSIKDSRQTSDYS